LGKKILGNFSLYMALHLIPSPHLGKNFPKFFISVHNYVFQKHAKFLTHSTLFILHIQGM